LLAYPPSTTIEVAREALLALLDARDFLGYQLAYSKGLIEKEEFQRIAEPYLKAPEAVDASELLKKVSALVALIGHRADTETVATVLRCDLDDAADALRGVARSIGAHSYAAPLPMVHPPPLPKVRALARPGR
jgi:hypothetical protein